MIGAMILTEWKGKADTPMEGRTGYQPQITTDEFAGVLSHSVRSGLQPGETPTAMVCYITVTDQSVIDAIQADDTYEILYTEDL